YYQLIRPSMIQCVSRRRHRSSLSVGRRCAPGSQELRGHGNAPRDPPRPGDPGRDGGGRALADAGPERGRRRGARGPVGAPTRSAAGHARDGGPVRILITGGAGFLGSHLAEAWLERGDDVTVLDPAPDVKVRHLRANPQFRIIRASVLERDILEGLVAWSDLVYH